PIRDLLNTRLTPLEGIGAIKDYFDIDPKDGKVLVREVVEKLDPNPVFDFLNSMDALDALVSSVPTGSLFELNLGSFDLSSVSDLRTIGSLDGVNPGNVNEADVAGQLSNNPQTQLFAQNLDSDKLGSTSGAGGGKFEIPILQHPAQAFKLL